MNDTAQQEFLSYDEVNMLQAIGARMQNDMWPKEFKLHTQGATITFTLDVKE